MESRPNVLPEEIICRIICLLNPLDVVRLRVVSKRFRDLTYDPLVWRSLYADAQLPRPPGPSPSQSIQFLEQTLVRSARLARTWTTQPVQVIRSHSLDVETSSMFGVPKVVCGRWLVTCQSGKRIVLYDTESETPHSQHSVQVIWEEEQGNIVIWDACSITSSEEHLVYFLACQLRAPGPSSSTVWTLLEFRLDINTGQLNKTTSLEQGIPPHFGGSMALVCSQGPFLYLRGAIFDTRSRICYNFPGFSTGLVSTATYAGAPSRVLFTDTHIVAFYVTKLVQVFALPTDRRQTSQGFGILKLTHEGEMHDTVVDMIVIKQPTVDLMTGTTTLRFLQARKNPTLSSVQFRCVDLKLPKAYLGDDSVLPLSVIAHELFSIDHPWSDQPSHYFSTRLGHSLDGHVRGIYVRYTRVARDSTNFFITKYMIDATPDECHEVRGISSSPTEFSDYVFGPGGVWFDGVRGKAYHWRSTAGSSTVSIMDVW